MPEEKQSATVAAAAVPQSEAEAPTLEVYSGTAEMVHPPESAPLVETDEAPRAPEEEHPSPLSAVAAAEPQSEADTRGEDEGAGIGDEQNGTLEPSSQHPDQAPSLPSTEIPLASTPPPGGVVQADHIVPEPAAALAVLPPPDAEGAQAALPHGAEDPGEEESGEASHLYQPPPQKPPRPKAERPVTQSPTRPASDLALNIRVRLTFDRSGYCEVRLLPERTAELDTEVDVKSGGTSLHLVAQEEWYEDLSFENIGERLLRGLELKGLLADHRRARWLLTGREIYVLASHPRASGFVSTTRLVLGRSHVVLCAAGLLPQVEAILNEAGSRGYTKLDEAHGVPSGWVGLRGVVPSRAVPLGPGSDPLYAIKPAPDIEIELEGGVCLHNSVWLAGFPPRIKLLGDLSGPVKLLIDGKEAIPAAEGSFAVEGYDLPGQHLVYCKGPSCSRSYWIEEPPDAWE
ncbi:MAG: hypothetical protein EXQ47_07845, partial [Bryobacterales bacterium]|nr:hypothetical protein [Bryobacterales bacterium]